MQNESMNVLLSFQTESPRHILVTDLDSAIAKVASEAEKMAENDIVHPMKVLPLLDIKKARSQMPVAPDINILPATPMNRVDEQEPSLCNRAKGNICFYTADISG